MAAEGSAEKNGNVATTIKSILLTLPSGWGFFCLHEAAPLYKNWRVRYNMITIEYLRKGAFGCV